MIDPQAWLVRRKIIIGVLVWAALLVTYLAIWGKPTSLSEAIATNLLLLMGGVIGSYVFGAVWDDKNKRATPGIVETKTSTVITPAPAAAVEPAPVDTQPPPGFAG